MSKYVIVNFVVYSCNRKCTYMYTYLVTFRVFISKFALCGHIHVPDQSSVSFLLVRHIIIMTLMHIIQMYMYMCTHHRGS